MSQLTIEQRVFLVEHFFTTNNAAEAVRRFAKHFGQQVDRTTVTRLVQRFREHGTVHNLPHPREKPACSSAMQTAALESVRINPHKSSRSLSAELGISRQSLRRICKENNIKLWKPKLVQGLTVDDFNRRVKFAEWFLETAHSDPSFLNSVIWSDECIVRLNGSMNRHNMVYYGEENPHWILESSMDKRSLMVWCGVSSRGLIGPFIFNSPVTSEVHLDMLKNQLSPLISSHQGLWFQQDGAPAHTARVVTAWLTERFGNRWIGRHGPHDCPPRSPDLTPPDFWLWSMLKDLIYKAKPKTLEDLQRAIFAACHHVNSIPGLCQKVCQSQVLRMEEVIEQHGAQLQHIGH